MTETEKKIDAMFERLVPRTGKSGTVAGEIVRAVSRIGYRYWNDGDHLGIGYGREVCNPAGRYLSERCGGAVAEAVRNAWGIDDEELYGYRLGKLEELVLKHLETHPELEQETNTEDFWDYRDRDEDVDRDEEEEW